MRGGICVALMIFLSTQIFGATVQCPKYLNIDDEKICLSPFRQTSPALAVKINDTTYFAATSLSDQGRLKFQYNGNKYSVYNYEYELIHWLSGQDELINGIWYDRMAGTTSDSSALNFTAVGDIKHTPDNGYYSENGNTAYFKTDYIPDINFGSDWYIEMVFDLRLTDNDRNGYFINLGFVSACIESPTDVDFPPYSFGLNLAADTFNAFGFQPDYIYKNGGKITYRFGVKKYNDTQSTAYQIADGKLLTGNNFTTRTYTTESPTYLFTYNPLIFDEPDIENMTVNGTIYDIKIYRRR